MPDLTDFHFGATVVSSEGRNVGTLKSVVVDQDGFDAHALAGGISAWAEEGRPLDPEDGYVAESGEAAAVLEARRRNT